MSDKKDMTMEEAYEALKSLIGRMEGEDLPLEDSFGLFEEGLSLVNLCNEKLDTIEKKIMILEEENEK